MAEIRTHYLDASALVALFVPEEESPKLRRYVDQHAVFASTSICFAEALGVLKRKFAKKQMLQEEYLSACEELIATIRSEDIQVEDVGISQRDVFDRVEIIARKYALDISDAFQLFTLKVGSFSAFQGDSAPMLITADRELAIAARKEGLRVWDCANDPAP